MNIAAVLAVIVTALVGQFGVWEWAVIYDDRANFISGDPLTVVAFANASIAKSSTGRHGVCRSLSS